MTASLTRLHLKGHQEIVVINSPASFDQHFASLEGVVIHRDPARLERVGFAIAFVKTDDEIVAAADAILPKAHGDPFVWFAYPKSTSKRYKCEFDRDKGWEPIREAGFESIRQLALDEDWSIVRFRRIEHIKRVFNPSRLAEFRNQRGWSQGELGNRASVVQNYISRLEKGRILSPDMQSLQKIADALDVPMTALLNTQQVHRGNEQASLHVSNGNTNYTPLRPVPLRVFICHSSLDKPAARDLYQRLKSEGFVPWLDEEDLLPGQNWKKMIPKAVSDSHVVVVCLSKTSINKQGFVQKEIGYALDVASEQPEDTIFIIPIRLEECVVPDRLAEWQWVDLFEPRGYERLLRALRHRAESLPLTEVA